MQHKNICCINSLLPGTVTDVGLHIHNPIYQDLIEEQDYFENTSDEGTNKMEKLEQNVSKISLYINLKNAPT